MNLLTRWLPWLVFCSSSVLATEIPRIDSAVVIDGDLNDAAWQQAIEMPIQFDTWPAENTPAPVSTIARVMEDGQNFYISFIAQDPDPTQIRAFFRDRDKIWDDDMVGVKIDTYHDDKLAYEFFVNPLGVQADAIENELTKSESDAWDGIWHSAGKITSTGYQVEIAIPLRLLNFNDRLAIQRWKLELLRFYPRDVRHRLSSNRIERANPCWICQMSTVTGFAGATQGKHFTVVPSLVFGAEQQRELTPSASDWQDSRTFEPSLDVKWGITPNINLNATINPDFSQIEADEAQVSLNDTFALFFDEKRPFFLDNADYFSSPLNLVYSRNVASPDVGARVTGRHDQQSFAFFAANDSSTTFIVPGNVSSGIARLDEKSNNAVLRYRYDYGQQWSFGWLTTYRSSEDYHNAVHGIDIKYQIDDQNKLVSQWLWSDTAYPEALNSRLGGEAKLRTSELELSGQAKFFSYEHENRDYFWYSRYTAFSEGFRADLGYMPQTDWNKQVHGGGYQWFFQDSNWNRIRLNGDWDITHSESGELLEKESELAVTAWGPSQTELSIGLAQRDRVGSRFDQGQLRVDTNTDLFREQQVVGFASIQPGSGLYLAVETEIGDKLDFRNNRLGHGIEVIPELRWNMDVHTQLTARHSYRSLRADGAKVFTVNLTDLRLSYQFSVQSFLRLALIYADIEQNPANNLGDVTARSKDLGTQLLYSYKLNPQTLFFAGYSDHAYSDDDVQAMTRDERSVFFKFSYAWVL